MIISGYQRSHSRLFIGSASWAASVRRDAYARQGRCAQARLLDSWKTTRDFGLRKTLGDAIAPTAGFDSAPGYGNQRPKPPPHGANPFKTALNVHS
jgi:hypothetical protein